MAFFFWGETASPGCARRRARQSSPALCAGSQEPTFSGRGGGRGGGRDNVHRESQPTTRDAHFGGPPPRPQIHRTTEPRAQRGAGLLSRISHTLSGIAGTLLVPKLGDDVELCERFVLGSSSNRESFSPSAFQLGEKVPKADEGAFHAYVIRAPSSALEPTSGKSRISRKAPPSSGFATFSPRKKPRGEKGSRRREWQGSRRNNSSERMRKGRVGSATVRITSTRSPGRSRMAATFRLPSHTRSCRRCRCRPE